MALDLGIVIAFTSTERPRVSLTSSSFGDRVEFDLDSVPAAEAAQEEGRWGNYPRGAALALQRNGFGLRRGIAGRIHAPA
eukprot:CAMPEP_0177618340 /NCGR_PEP_ID=MMETSP0419_2-20121207/25515_1 /TAXON_ID=582737 /ORGANISM="Tetraselmis sp., Strain GSL018" /LENGTH=79 /DNA_ID=CAMNT_0019117215 /DNA_START=343 /DNA_END=578 /DNA_ORIENTATION=-